MNTFLLTAARTTCALTALASGSAFATQYLSADEAQRAIFPEATTFKAQPLDLNAEQMKEVQKVSGLPARSVQWRVSSAWRGDTLLGYVVLDEVIGKYELISYAAGVNPDATIHQIEILTYRESHGFEIRNAAWRKQFVGKSAQAGLAIGEGITNISGASLSSAHVTDGVRRIAAVVQVALKK
ncbi:FMN-binding protein [Actimicrobium antarcticum]|uniref:FMN-binding domain-containing protein n=1 Tax=Actimicrobium antarcticum TaxID=1051899 RepID=A0ABP7TTU5_9BURK